MGFKIVFLQLATLGFAALTGLGLFRAFDDLDRNNKLRRSVFAGCCALFAITSFALLVHTILRAAGQ
ncbi:hypothetical protein A3731_22930 [Roseovarius sp. HI0049]|nr:hypothetical protein A3731_22930 [Roseovarius sp. HI0049]